MKLLLLTILSIQIFCVSYANCDSTIILSSQSEVNSFITDFGCTELGGDLIIGKQNGFGLTDITNLDSLMGITSINGELLIRFTNISSLSGLNALSSITGDLKVVQNPNLTSLVEFESLSLVNGQIYLYANENLQDLSGLSGLNTYIPVLTISYNTSLVNLQGLENITSLGGLNIQNNDNLQSIEGLSGLTEINDLIITSNALLPSLIGLENISSADLIRIRFNDSLINLEGLNNLTFVQNDFLIENNTSLISLEGLDNLDEIQGEFELRDNPSLINFNGLLKLQIINNFRIINNNSLINFNGLDLLEVINGYLLISNNTILFSLEGLESLQAELGMPIDVFIYENPILDECCPLMSYLSDFVDYDIYDNGPLCNSEEAILENCSINVLGFEISLKVYLEGSYENGELGSNLEGIIPFSQPYNTSPWDYSGIENVLEMENNVVDWVLVEIRTGIPNLTDGGGTTVIDSKAGLLLSNGEIVDVNNELIRFTNLEIGEEYYISIRHRNHLDVMSASPIIGDEYMEYDFTTNISKALGAFQQKMNDNGTASMISGDINGDCTIQTTDYDIWFSGSAVLNSYNISDLNLDNVVQTTDYDIWFTNKAKVGIVELQY